jgi:hypothetical protein
MISKGLQPEKEINLSNERTRSLGASAVRLLSPLKMAKTGSRPPKKEKVFHPDSRKASQLSRMQLRKAKVAEAASKRTKKQSIQGAHPMLH